jgi:hypothetical protein
MNFYPNRRESSAQTILLLRNESARAMIHAQQQEA